MNDSDEIFATAVRQHQAGHLTEATKLYAEVLKLEPTHAQARELLDFLSQQNLATQPNPDLAQTHFSLGLKLAASGEHPKAIEEFRTAIRLVPTEGRYRYQLGLSLQALRQYDAAVAVYRGALDAAPEMTDAWSCLGIVLSELGRTEEAIKCLLHVPQLAPSNADGYYNLGVCYASLWQHSKAVAYLRKAIELSPSKARYLVWLGKSLYMLGDVREAIDSLRTALQYAPQAAEAHWTLSLAHLLLGEYKQGWKEYEWRWKWNKFPAPKRPFSQPLWNGKPLRGRTILLHAEQGFGDTLQFVRYVPLVAKAGGRVILEVPSPLYALLRDHPGVAVCIRTGEPLPDFDVHSPLMSLPLAFGTRLSSIPAPVSLTVTPRTNPLQQPSSSADPQPLRIGLVWAGNKGHQLNAQRSLEWSQFVPLSKISSRLQFVSLQKGIAAAQYEEALQTLRLENGITLAKDFAETAAIVAGLDLVITVDTAVAHLAATMGKPVWILIPETPDWRWGLEVETSPWYPTARLFRVTRDGGWTELINRVAEELKLLSITQPTDPASEAIAQDDRVPIHP